MHEISVGNRAVAVAVAVATFFLTRMFSIKKNV